MRFWWWDDAVAHAVAFCEETGLKLRVTRGEDAHWHLSLQVEPEPCS